MSPSTKRALCVGNDRDGCASLAALMRLDYEVTTAVGAAEALEKTLAGGFDLVVVDDRGVDSTALTLCRVLRQHPAAPSVLCVSSVHVEPARAAAAEARGRRDEVALVFHPRFPNRPRQPSKATQSHRG